MSHIHAFVRIGADELNTHADAVEQWKLLTLRLCPAILVVYVKRRDRRSRDHGSGDGRHIGYQFVCAGDIKIPFLGVIAHRMIIGMQVSPDLGVDRAAKAGFVVVDVVRHASGILGRDQGFNGPIVADAGKIDERNGVAQAAAQLAGLVVDGQAQSAGLEGPLVLAEIAVGLVGNVDADVAGAGRAAKQGCGQQRQGGRERAERAFPPRAAGCAGGRAPPARAAYLGYRDQLVLMVVLERVDLVHGGGRAPRGKEEPPSRVFDVVS
ncbi:hypothetical protein LMG26696_01218 [Achromobacter pulmonis]|nr:hypothetical protein LMG26696_01218 [Achromobacter pulmonis]